jgi:phosphoribosyl 1,2-cyclic phosphodiesterase
MLITFYGVRGSIPSPGPDTVKYGGNTPCVFIELENDQNVVLDAGTGIRMLGKKYSATDSTINILLSHSHWDHIQGYPFFAPIYQAGRQIRVYTGTASDHAQLCSLFDQMDGANFPVHANELPSNGRCILENVEQTLAEDGILVRRRHINHPGGGCAYRIEGDGTSCAYVTDNELDPPGRAATTYDQWVEFCHGADVLIHDAMYQEDDMPQKHGWGHSLMSQVRRLAVDAEVGCLVMFHHDPNRTDAELDFIQADNNAFLKGLRTPTHCVCAAEGMQIRLTAPAASGTATITVS